MLKTWINRSISQEVEREMLCRSTLDPAACRVHSAGWSLFLPVSVQWVFAALASSALALANWLGARRVRVRQITGASWGRRAHRGRWWWEKALQARLTQQKIKKNRTCPLEFLLLRALYFKQTKYTLICIENSISVQSTKEIIMLVLPWSITIGNTIVSQQTRWKVVEKQELSSAFYFE